MNTLDRLRDILVRNYPLQRDLLTPDARLETLDIDSLGLMELLFAIEEEFGLEIPNEKQPLNTLAEVVDYIDRLQQQQRDLPLEQAIASPSASSSSAPMRPLPAAGGPADSTP